MSKMARYYSWTRFMHPSRKGTLKPAMYIFFSVTITWLICTYKYSNEGCTTSSSKIIRSIKDNDNTGMTSCYRYNDGNKTVKAEKRLKLLGCKHRLPSALILGVKKCGTGALRYFLDLHPQIEVIGTPNFENRNLNDSMKRWASRMPLTTPKQKVVAEYQSTVNLYQNFYSMDKLKYIFILRDPVERAVSDYLHVRDFSFRNKNAISYRTERLKDGGFKTFMVYKNYELLPTFEESILAKDRALNRSHALIAKGLYLNRMRWHINRFGRENVIIIDGNSFQRKPVPVLRTLEKFLGISPFFKKDHFHLDSNGNFYCPNIKERPDKKCVSEDNATKGRKHPEVDENVLQMLRLFYQPYNRKLQKYLNQTLIWVD